MKASYIEKRERIQEKERNKDIAKGLGFSLMSSLMALHEAFGFREKRLQKFADSYMKYVTMVQDKRMGLKEFREMCEHTTGIKLEYKWYWEDDEL